MENVHTEKKCDGCVAIGTYYEGTIKFPIKCRCKEGYIHCEISWGFDDGCDSATYYAIKCFNCNREKEFLQPDYIHDFCETLEEFFKKEPEEKEK